MIVSYAVSCLRTGLTACCDRFVRAEHQYEFASIEGIPKDASNAFRCILCASLLCPNCSPSGALLAACCCTALLLTSLGRSTLDKLRHPSRLHPQHGCWGSLRAACGGSPGPGAGLGYARTPTYDLARNRPAQDVMHRAVRDHKHAARASHAQARVGPTARGGTSAQEAQSEVTGNVSRARVSVRVYLWPPMLG